MEELIYRFVAQMRATWYRAQSGTSPSLKMSTSIFQLSRLTFEKDEFDAGMRFCFGLWQLRREQLAGISVVGPQAAHYDTTATPDNMVMFLFRRNRIPLKVSHLKLLIISSLSIRPFHADLIWN